MNKRIKLASLALSSLVIAGSASAEMQWSDFSLSYLYGTDYEFTPNGKMQVMTLEHTSGHSWGDNFLFIDRTMPSEGSSSFYGELSPRLSFGKLTSSDLSFGPINDVLIAGTWEMGDGFDNFLYGVGVGLTVPGFKYFNLNLYHASNDVWDDDNQLTITWGAPFSIGNQDFLIDGFMDWSTASDTNKSEMNLTPQFKWNAGKNFNLKSPLYLGVEYAYWNNKYGSDVDERVASLLVKWHF
ncbi:ion channel protein Tsx [Agarivorans sp. TSD2052]|uniref:outer membrane protein OmpK n=1 Tax=Agarivorans sp. TSD2052 TaxID=2937286 RepID=UPI00200FE4C1|nr:outer membrane protein OmpK [Agarivorans sp. TSD2052]UPW19752.1 ion channel protein Tsx [Agarivorans sp. TSD2052]